MMWSDQEFGELVDGIEAMLVERLGAEYALTTLVPSWGDLDLPARARTYICAVRDALEFWVSCVSALFDQFPDQPEIRFVDPNTNHSSSLSPGDLAAVRVVLGTVAHVAEEVTLAYDARVAAGDA